MRVRSAVVVGILGLASIAPTSSAAPDEAARRPPEAILKSRHVRQHPRLWSYCWSYTDGDGGVSTCADGVWSFTRADLAHAGAKVRLVFRRAQKPSRLSLHSYRELARDGDPRGDGRKVDYRLRAVRRPDRGIVAYAAVFRAPDRERHLYLDAFVRWNEWRGSGGDASYTWHLKLVE